MRSSLTLFSRVQKISFLFAGRDTEIDWKPEFARTSWTSSIAHLVQIYDVGVNFTVVHSDMQISCCCLVAQRAILDVFLSSLVLKVSLLFGGRNTEIDWKPEFARKVRRRSYTQDPSFSVRTAETTQAFSESFSETTQAFSNTVACCCLVAQHMHAVTEIDWKPKFVRTRNAKGSPPKSNNSGVFRAA